MYLRFFFSKHSSNHASLSVTARILDSTHLVVTIGIYLTQNIREETRAEVEVHDIAHDARRVVLKG